LTLFQVTVGSINLERSEKPCTGGATLKRGILRALRKERTVRKKVTQWKNIEMSTFLKWQCLLFLMHHFVLPIMAHIYTTGVGDRCGSLFLRLQDENQLGRALQLCFELSRMEVFELVPFSVSIIQLSIKYPKLEVVAPSFAKNGDEIKSQDEKIKQEIRGDQTSSFNLN
jgi:hypothetical protein